MLRDRGVLRAAELLTARILAVRRPDQRSENRVHHSRVITDEPGRRVPRSAGPRVLITTAFPPRVF